MTGIYVASMPLEPDTLVVVSRSLRCYLGLSRDASYVHHVRPVRLEEPIVATGRRAAGDLTCDCRGGQVHGRCYWVVRAEALEAADPTPFRRPDWAAPDPVAELFDGTVSFDAPLGAGEEVEAWRG